MEGGRRDLLWNWWCLCRDEPTEPDDDPDEESEPRMEREAREALLEPRARRRRAEGPAAEPALGVGVGIVMPNVRWTLLIIVKKMEYN